MQREITRELVRRLLPGRMAVPLKLFQIFYL